MRDAQAIDEQAVVFDCEGAPLVGIVSRPRAGEPATGLVIVVGGPQYRAGSHRQFVLLARTLAAAGHAVLRFDYRGMGDSQGAKRDFLDVSPDIDAAIGALQRTAPSVRRVALWGLCDAASAVLLYCESARDARVQGLCLLNPWVRSGASLARTHVKHYYLQRFLQREFWRKLLRGGVALGALAELARNLRLATKSTRTAAAAQLPFQARMARAWRDFQGPRLLVLSGEDFTAKEFLEFAKQDEAWQGALAHPALQRCDIAQADHTFSASEARRDMERHTLLWLDHLNGK